MATQRFYDGQPGPDIRRELNNFEAILDGTVAAAQDASTAATDSKNAAATSATAAKTSETNAASSASAAASSANAAAASESAALASKNAAATSATAAKTSETNAASSASAAASSANAAAASAGGQIWVSGTTYAVGALVFSALTGRNYRSIVAGAGTTDPSADTTNWRATLLDVDTGMPTIRPSLLLDFANSRSVDPRVTSTRASAATRVNERGLLEVVAAGVPRIDFDPVTLACRGWLIEEARTNLLPYSDQFDNAVWIKTGATIAANVIAAPDGTLTADKLVEDTSNGIHRVSFGAAGLANNASRCLSVFAKAAEHNVIELVINAFGGNYIAATFNLLTGAVSSSAFGNGVVASANAYNVGGGYWRVCLAGTPYTTSASAVADHYIRLANGATNSYTGDGTSGIYVWGAQLEAGSFPTSYIPTTTAAATRAAEVPVMTGSNFSSWYRQDEGAFVCTFDSTGSTGTAVPLGVATTGVFNESMYVSRQADGGVFSSVIDNGISQFPTIGLGSSVADVAFNVALAYKLNDSAAVGNGSALVTDNVCTTPTVDRMSIGHSPWSQSLGFINGHIRRIAYYPKRLSDAELQALTTP